MRALPRPRVPAVRRSSSTRRSTAEDSSSSSRCARSSAPSSSSIRRPAASARALARSTVSPRLRRNSTATLPSSPSAGDAAWGGGSERSSGSTFVSSKGVLIAAFSCSSRASGLGSSCTAGGVCLPCDLRGDVCCGGELSGAATLARGWEGGVSVTLRSFLELVQPLAERAQKPYQHGGDLAVAAIRLWTNMRVSSSGARPEPLQYCAQKLSNFWPDQARLRPVSPDHSLSAHE